MQKFTLRILIVLNIWFISTDFMHAKTLDHEIFLQEMKNSSDQVYQQCLNKYDAYLKMFPDDLMVHIEKCKFILYAQYDEVEEINPNQAEFDSCVSLLVEKYPNEPEVFVFQTTYLWGDKLSDLFEKAENSINENPLLWSKKNLAALYLKISLNYYWEEEYDKAHEYIIRAVNQDSTHRSSLEYARILIAINQKEEALNALLSIKDTTKIAWQLSEKADLLVQLEAYTEALKLYKLIDEIDSTYNNNSEIAKTLERVGEYSYARIYLISDTSQHWNKETAIRNLLIHDIKYHDGDKCIETYNTYRDFGYSVDPIGIYRIKILFLHPFQALKFRDVISILTFLLFLGLLILLPSIWILPVYFVGHHWSFIEKQKSFETLWGLKAFWFVSVGYLFSTLFTVFVDPEIIYSNFNSSYSTTEPNQDQIGLMALIFITVFATFGFASLYKKDSSILLSKLWNIRKSILVGIGVLIIYKIVIGIYVKIGASVFDIKLETIANIPNVILSSKQEVEALISSYGLLVGFIIVCILVPIYEEIIFRGVIFDACHHYINFNTANIIQSVLFAAIHMDLFLFPVFFLFGIITGILRKKSGGLLPGIVFHIANNALAVLILSNR